MSKTIVRYGMIGGSAGAFIGDVHRKAIAFDRRAELVCGCFSRNADINRETGKSLRLDDGRVYSDYADMARLESARQDRPDFIVITTPNSLHYEIAREFLLRDINVVCEKPLCFEIEQAQELQALADSRGLLFAVTYAYSGYAMVKFARALVQGGKIGDIISVNAEYLQDWFYEHLENTPDGVSPLPVWRIDPKYTGIANCTGDIGTHIENTVAYITGLEIARISAKTHDFGHGLDIHANMMIEYTNGISGLYTCSQICAGHHNGLVVRIFGTKGAVEWQQESPDVLKVTYKGEPTQLFTRGNAYISGRAATISRIPSGHPEGYYIAFANLYEAFIGALLKKANGEPLTPDDLDFPTVRDGVSGVKFVHAVVNSAKNDSQWVGLL